MSTKATRKIANKNTVRNFDGRIYTKNIGVRGAGSEGKFEIPRATFAAIMKRAGVPDEYHSSRTSAKGRMTTALGRSISDTEKFRIAYNDAVKTVWILGSLEGKSESDANATLTNAVVLDKSTGTLAFHDAHGGEAIEKKFRELENVLTAREVAKLIERYLERELGAVALNRNSGAGYYVPTMHTKPDGSVIDTRDALLKLEAATYELGGQSGACVLEFVDTTHNRERLATAVINELDAEIMPAIARAEEIAEQARIAKRNGETPKVHGKSMRALMQTVQTCQFLVECYSETMSGRINEASARLKKLNDAIEPIIGFADVVAPSEIPDGKPF